MGSANNTVVLSGRLTREPKVTGKITSFGLAVDRAGRTFNEAGFFNVMIFETNERLTKLAANFMKKGTPVLVQGRLRFTQTEGEGKKTTYIEIVAEDIQLLGSKKDADAEANGSSEVMDTSEESTLEAALEAGL